MPSSMSDESRTRSSATGSTGRASGAGSLAPVVSGAAAAGAAGSFGAGEYIESVVGRPRPSPPQLSCGSDGTDTLNVGTAGIDAAENVAAPARAANVGAGARGADTVADIPTAPEMI